MSERSDPLPEFLGEGTNVPLEHARAVVLPAPVEASVSYGGGTRHGPAAILRASTQVELYHDVLECQPHLCGVATAAPVPDRSLPLEAAVRAVGRRVGQLVDDGKWVVTLGGEHSITPGAVAAVAERYTGLHVVQLDAHADLRDSYGGSPWSHACAMARCLDHAPVRGVGIRSWSEGEAERLVRGIAGHSLVHAREIGAPGWIDRTLEGLAGRSVYLTVDVDYFDPSIVPATGTPEPGGGTWWPTLRLLEALFERSVVVAADVVELAPIDGLHHPDFTVARLVHSLIGLRFRGASAS